ncbi:uncharacterized protein [Maniola hyperantus]|uniref:uncharacterized protein isoform X1 n=1 Tax=Aphantopus hyperantus TaxID=2795564 RepID=UPI00374A6E70
MGNYKILCIVCLAILSFHIRGSQSRSLNDDESEHNISKQSGNIEDCITDCPCFPISVKGTPVSKSLPSNDEQERLVVYLYRNKNSGELTSYIPSWKKQSIFPDLTFDIGDKLQTVPADGIINLFDIATIKGLEETTAANARVEIPSIPTSENEHKNDSGASSQDLNSITLVTTPAEESTVFTVSPNNKLTTGVTKDPNLTVPTVSRNNKITTGVTKNPNLNLSLGNKQQTLKGTNTKPNQNLKPSDIINQTPVKDNGLFAHLLPVKPRTEEKTIIKNEPNKMPPVIQNQQTPHKSYSLMANTISGKPRTAGETIIINSPEHHSQIPNKIINEELNLSLGQQNNLVNIVGYLPSKYKNPTFNDWFSEQMLSLRSQRPSMSDAINFHVLKLLLIKALYENGIHPSKNGELHDSNGNTLKMSNLKLRSILLSDPIEYEKLIATKKCVIPYDLPYLEAVLVTLVYPPRTLAIIPLDSKNVFISSVPGKETPKLCGESRCQSKQSSRLGFPMKKMNNLDINDNIHNDDVHSYTAEKTFEDREPIHSNNIESKNAYTYMGASSDPTERLSQEPKYDDQYSLHPTSDPRRRAFEINKANEENYDNALITEESDVTLDKNEPIYMDYMGFNKDLAVEASLEPKSHSQNSLFQTQIPIQPEIYGGKPNILLWTQPKSGGEIIYLDEEGNIQGRRALEDFDDSQETPEKLDDEDYENMLHIKIVGGNPATSSGTPVNSKGRSGLDF